MDDVKATQTKTRTERAQLAFCIIKRWVVNTGAAAERWFSMSVLTELEMGGAEFSSNQRI